MGHPAWRFGERLFQRFNDSRLPLLAAALAYYAAFSLGPLLLLLTGGVGFLLRSRPDLAEDARLALVNLVAQITPPQNDQVQTQLIEGSFEALEQLLVEGALVRSVVSLLILIWASSNFFSSLQLALELIFASPHPRNFWRKRLVAIPAHFHRSHGDFGRGCRRAFLRLFRPARCTAQQPVRHAQRAALFVATRTSAGFS